MSGKESSCDSVFPCAHVLSVAGLCAVPARFLSAHGFILGYFCLPYTPRFQHSVINNVVTFVRARNPGLSTLRGVGGQGPGYRPAVKRVRKRSNSETGKTELYTYYTHREAYTRSYTLFYTPREAHTRVIHLLHTGKHIPGYIHLLYTLRYTLVGNPPRYTP